MLWKRLVHEKEYTYLHGAALQVRHSHWIACKNYAQWTILPEQTASRLHKPFTEREIAILWANTDSKAVRLALIYIYTGLRPTELLRVKTEGVFISERYLRAGMKTKAGKTESSPLRRKYSPSSKNYMTKTTSISLLTTEMESQ